jgi:hypothetical protein
MALRRDSALLGKTPAGATHWTLSRKGALAWESCTWRTDVEWQTEFPLADLGVAVIRKRWGEGIYRVSFLSLGRGGRQSLGPGRVFEIDGATERTPTPRPAEAQRPQARAVAMGETPKPPARPATDVPEDHSPMIHALLRAAEGKRTPAELFEALAVPTGMGLSSLFSQLERVAERLEVIERRLSALEDRSPQSPSRAPETHLDRVLDKLDAIEQRLAHAVPSSRPGGRKNRESPAPR